MPRSTHKSVRVPYPVADGIEILRKREILKFDSFGGVIVSAARYILIAPGPHTVTEAIDRMGHADQDTIDDFLLALTDRGLAYRRQLMDHITRGDPYVPTSQPDMARELLKLARKWKADPANFDWSQIGKDPDQLEFGI